MRKIRLITAFIIIHIICIAGNFGTLQADGAYNSLNITIEYIDFINKGFEIPPLDVTREDLIKILKGETLVYIVIKNAPKSFKKIGLIKRNKKESKKLSSTAFDITPFILAKYNDRKPKPIHINGPDKQKLVIPIDKDLKINDWDKIE